MILFLYRSFFISALFLLALLIFVPALSAQTFKGGLVAGFNLSQLDGDKLAGYNKIGLNAGGRVSVDLSERWGFSMQLLFSQTGSSRTRDDDPNSIYDKIRLNFVEAPLLFHFTDWKFELDAGFSYARLMDHRVIDFTGVDISENQNYRPNIYSAIVGVTFWPNETIGWNFRWLRTFSDLQANPGDNRFIGRTISLRIYYML